MTLPAFFLGALIATLMGSLFHLWQGGSGGRLLLYLALAWGGFWAGQWLAARFGLTFLHIGPLNTGAAVLGAAGALALGWWLGRVESY